MTLPTVEDFLDRLRAVGSRRKRIDAEDYRQAFAVTCPALSAPDARAKLAGWLLMLSETNDISLPKGNRLYDRSSSGDLPAWIELTHPDEINEPLPVDPESFGWAPELRFGHLVRDARRLNVLLQVQRFLAEDGRSRPFVPVKERSIELFGKEKRLEMLRSSWLFAPGRLSLDLLRCFVVPPPLVWRGPQTRPTAGPLLIVENHNTYHSFVQWNNETSCFAAIVFGNGDAFKSSAAGLSEIVRTVSWDGRFFYFGDIDPEGLIIPLAASATLSTIDMPSVSAHRGCYRRLLTRATVMNLPTGDRLCLPTDSRSWLGENLAEEVESWFAKGIRVAQELVGLEQLLLDGLQFTVV